MTTTDRPVWTRATFTPGDPAVYQVRPTKLRRWLSSLPGRCSACAGHLATQGHARHCPLGPRARFALGADGRMLGTSTRGPE